jgi:hypothetical protein
VPFANNAHEWAPPALIATAVVRPRTATGVDAFVVVPFPNWPNSFSPQQLTVRFANNAHEWPPPALIATALVRVLNPLTTTDVDASVVVPFPNWPQALSPQHLAEPFANNAHEWELPAEIADVTRRAPAPCATAPAGTVSHASPAAINATATAMRAIPIRAMTAPLRESKPDRSYHIAGVNTTGQAEGPNGPSPSATRTPKTMTSIRATVIASALADVCVGRYGCGTNR